MNHSRLLAILLLLVFNGSIIHGKTRSAFFPESKTYSDGFNATFIVTSDSRQVSGTVINLSGYGEKLTNSEGRAIFNHVQPSDSIYYQAYAPGYREHIDSIQVMDTDVIEEVNLELVGFKVTFTILIDGQPMANAKVNLEGYSTKITNVTGSVVFTQVLPAENLPYTIIAFGYQTIQGTVNINYQDLIESVQLTPALYRGTFHIATGHTPVSNAKIELTGYGIKYSDDTGEAVFDSISPEFGIIYTVNIPGYSQWLGAIDVIDQDVVESVAFPVSSFNVYFIVLINQDPLLGALIKLDGYGQQTTNVNGLASFINVEVSDRIDYTITTDKYGIFSDSIRVVDQNVYEYVFFTGVNDKTPEQVQVYPNPGSGSFTLDLEVTSTVTIFSVEGKELFSGTFSAGKQPLNLPGLSSGLYLIRVDQGVETIYGKIFIK